MARTPLYRCTNCRFETPFQRDIVDHPCSVASGDTDAKRPLKCRYSACAQKGLRLKNERTRNRHEEIHDSTIVKPRCPDCGRKLSRGDALKRHRKDSCPKKRKDGDKTAATTSSATKKSHKRSPKEHMPPPGSGSSAISEATRSSKLLRSAAPSLPVFYPAAENLYVNFNTPQSYGAALPLGTHGYHHMAFPQAAGYGMGGGGRVALEGSFYPVAWPPLPNHLVYPPSVEEVLRLSGQDPLPLSVTLPSQVTALSSNKTGVSVARWADPIYRTPATTALPWQDEALDLCDNPDFSQWVLRMEDLRAKGVQ